MASINLSRVGFFPARFSLSTMTIAFTNASRLTKLGCVADIYFRQTLTVELYSRKITIGISGHNLGYDDPFRVFARCGNQSFSADKRDGHKQRAPALRMRLLQDLSSRRIGPGQNYRVRLSRHNRFDSLAHVKSVANKRPGGRRRGVVLGQR